MGRIDLAEYSSTLEAGHRRKCNRIELSECPGVTQAGQRRKCNRIELFESRNRYRGLGTTTNDAKPSNPARPRFASCLATFSQERETAADSDGHSAKTDNEERYSAKCPEKQWKPHESKGNGGGWKSNPLGPLFTTPTGFEDLGRHQPYKHPRGGPRHCKAH